MDALEAIDILDTCLREAKERGVDSVSTSTLETVLSNARELAEKYSGPDAARHEFELERYRYLLAGRNTRWSNRLSVMRDMTSHTINSGISALKSATLINGGAAVALLAFAGQAQNSESGVAIMDSIAPALGCFAFGVLLSAVAVGATYVSQAAFGREFDSWSLKAGRRWRQVAVAGVFLAFVSFVAGGVVCVRTFNDMPKPSETPSQQKSVPSSVPTKKATAKVA